MRIQEVLKGMRSVLASDAAKFNREIDLVDEPPYIESEIVSRHPTGMSTVCRSITDNPLKLEISKNPRTASDVLSSLATDHHERVRMQVAANPSTAGKTLARMAKDNRTDVLLRVAANPNTPAEVLAHLARHKDKEVRIRVARNPNAGYKNLSRLLLDEDYRVRSCVSTNINKQAQLSRHNNYDCSRANSDTNHVLDVLSPLVADEDPLVRAAIARRSSTPGKVLARLARDKSSQVRMHVAGNTNTSAKVLAFLADDWDENVRCNVAVNPNTQNEVLSRLVLDSVRAVRMGVLLNPDASEELKSLVRLMELRREAIQDAGTSKALQVYRADDAISFDTLHRNLYIHLLRVKTLVSSFRTTLETGAIGRVRNTLSRLYRAAIRNQQ